MCDLLKKSRDIVIPPMLLKSINEKKIFFETYTNSEQKVLFSFFNNNDKYLILIALLLSSNDQSERNFLLESFINKSQFYMLISNLESKLIDNN